MALHRFEIFADYHQFYVWDSGVGPSAPEDYTDDDVRSRVKVAPNVVVVQPVRDVTVPVDLEIHDTDPGFEKARWDHIAECSLDLPTGRLQVDECTGSVRLDLEVSPGTYVVRVLFSGLDTLSGDGLEGSDRYRIDLWPGSTRELKVIKQWNEGTGI